MGDGLVQEAEKLLCQLICYTGEKKIRMKFIEGCVANLATNRLGFTKVEAINFIAIAFHHFFAVTKLENSCVRLLFFII